MAEGSKLTPAGKAVVGLFVLACLFGAYYFFIHGHGSNSTPETGGTPHTPGHGLQTEYTGPKVEIGLAFGTEKENWLKWAVADFAKTDAGGKITVKLIPKGSLEGGQAIWRDEDKGIQVWSPASSLYKAEVVREWQPKHGNNPILKEESLALSPMVFVFWEERYKAFIDKYKTVSFSTIHDAVTEDGGWDAIAKQPDWGVFKFGHTHPQQSNSGLVTLLLMGYSFHNKKETEPLQNADILDKKFQDWMVALERGVYRMSNSTGNMMQDMVRYGPSTFDCLFVYESVVIDYLKNAQGRWGTLKVVYPRHNLWNDNPYYILDVPWSSADQRKAAEVFLQFLMSERVQKESLTHGFRPGNTSIPIREVADSPFVLYEKSGLKIDLNQVCAPPAAEVQDELLRIWERRAKK
jgi:hypothetical protein